MITEVFDPHSPAVISPEQAVPAEELALAAQFELPTFILFFSGTLLALLAESGRIEPLHPRLTIGSAAGRTPIYRLPGTRIGVALSGIGAPAAAGVVEELRVQFHTKSFLVFGSCGALIEIPPGRLILPTPEPTPEPTPAPTEWVLSDESPEEILALAEIPGLQLVDGGNSREYEALVQLRELRPDCTIFWQVPLQGRMLPHDTEALTLSSTEGLEEALAGLPCLKTVDLTACRPEIPEMDRLYTRYPQVEFLWVFTMGQEGHRQWEVRSDCVCFSSLWTGDERYRYTEEDYYPLLRFCRHLRALDLGHSDIKDVSLIGELTELQALILADNPRITDISPLANLHELVYLELFMDFDIEDFSCLYQMPKMIDLNLSYCKNLDDVGFIDTMPDFQNGWFRNSQVTWDMVRGYYAKGMHFVVGSPEELSAVLYGWRDYPRARAIRHAFHNWKDVVEFRSWDDIVYR